jgi:hypothetical protein
VLAANPTPDSLNRDPEFFSPLVPVFQLASGEPEMPGKMLKIEPLAPKPSRARLTTRNAK